MANANISLPCPTRLRGHLSSLDAVAKVSKLECPKGWNLKQILLRDISRICGFLHADKIFSMHLVCKNSVEIVLPCVGALVKFNLLLQAMSFLSLVASCSQSGSSSGCKMETFIDQQFGIGFGLISSHTSQCHMPSNAIKCLLLQAVTKIGPTWLDSQHLLFYQALCTAIFGTHKGFYVLASCGITVGMPADCPGCPTCHVRQHIKTTQIHLLFKVFVCRQLRKQAFSCSISFHCSRWTCRLNGCAQGSPCHNCAADSCPLLDRRQGEDLHHWGHMQRKANWMTCKHDQSSQYKCLVIFKPLRGGKNPSGQA